MSSTNSLPPPCAPEVAESLGLAGLTVFPMPKTDIVATIHKYAEERYRQLEEGTSVEETLIFTGATIAHVNAIRPADPNGIYPGRITFFGNNSGLLFIRMARPIHEEAHSRLFAKIMEWVLKMGLNEDCHFVGSSRYEGTGSCAKEGDNGLRPNPPRAYGNDFPTLVVEVGNIESHPRFRKDKDWWFENSPPGEPQGDVKVVIIIKVYTSSKRILLEQWHRGQGSASQTVIIKPNPQTAFSIKKEDWQTHWVVTGAPLKIKFEDVFPRPKEGEECDFIFDKEGLAKLAIFCWQSNTKH